jgi:hypothetical protein
MVNRRGEPISKEAYEYLVKVCLEERMANYRELASKMKHGKIIENEITRSNAE